MFAQRILSMPYKKLLSIFAGLHQVPHHQRQQHQQQQQRSLPRHPQQQQRRSRAGRVRTVLTEKQLSLLKSCYSANPRPDALMKEQLVEMTGLSPRVVRVWFQNKRCKDKKKLALKQGKVRYEILNFDHINATA